jgi:hypothetical protein
MIHCYYTTLLQIETLREFRSAVAKWARKGVQAHDIDFSDWTMQQVDFSSMPQDEWESYDFKGASFWGCTLPSYTSRADLERHGATVMEQLKGLPFLAIRAHMYKQAELNEIDHPTYEWYLANRGIRNLIAQSIHDFFIQVRAQQACAKAVQHTLPFLTHICRM